MIDWYLLLTPILLIPIVALFVFVGCALQHSGIPPTTPPLPTIRPNVILELDSSDYFVSSVLFVVDYLANDSDYPASRSETLHASDPSTSTGTSDLGHSTSTTILIAGNLAIFRYTIMSAALGSWTVHCTVTLQGATTPLPTVSHALRSIALGYSPNDEIFLFRLQRNPTTGNPEVVAA